MTAPTVPAALSSPILVLGAPRSGTTWLAKILDSHPDIIYRHEPDDDHPPPAKLDPRTLAALLQAWAGDRAPRTSTKRPYFRKSWQSATGRHARALWAMAASAADRLPAPLNRLARLPIPDFANRPAPRLAIKTVGWPDGVPFLARTLPDSRTFFILRHPNGQVRSVMRGNARKQFDLKTSGTDMPFDEAATIRFARTFGIDDPAFQALPDAAKYAWSWRAFNEPAYAALAALPNVQIVLYETLCAAPLEQSERIIAFAGLDWNPQTEDFVRRSTTFQGDAGYYAIFRDAAAAAEGWRASMPPNDQQAVRSVMAGSPLAPLWPDLLNGT